MSNYERLYFETGVLQNCHFKVMNSISGNNRSTNVTNRLSLFHTARQTCTPNVDPILGMEQLGAANDSDGGGGGGGCAAEAAEDTATSDATEVMIGARK